MTATERKNLGIIKAKWEHLKDAGDRLQGSAYATAIALWAAMNVDYLIALAERTDR